MNTFARIIGALNLLILLGLIVISCTLGSLLMGIFTTGNLLGLLLVFIILLMGLINSLIFLIGKKQLNSKLDYVFIWTPFLSIVIMIVLFIILFI